MKNDYNTVMNNSYQFNPNEAQNAKGVLDKKLLKYIIHFAIKIINKNPI